MPSPSNTGQKKNWVNSSVNLNILFLLIHRFIYQKFSLIYRENETIECFFWFSFFLTFLFANESSNHRIPGKKELSKIHNSVDQVLLTKINHHRSTDSGKLEFVVLILTFKDYHLSCCFL